MMLVRQFSYEEMYISYILKQHTSQCDEKSGNVAKISRFIDTIGAAILWDDVCIEYKAMIAQTEVSILTDWKLGDSKYIGLVKELYHEPNTVELCNRMFASPEVRQLRAQYCAAVLKEESDIWEKACGPEPVEYWPWSES